MLFRPLVYVQVSAGSLTAHLVGENSQATVPCAALAHPRTLMGNFIEVQAAMKEAFTRLRVTAWYQRAPVALTHLMPTVEGGYTNVELRAFREAALGAGASQSWMLANHPPLSPHDIEEVRRSLGKAVL